MDVAHLRAVYTATSADFDRVTDHVERRIKAVDSALNRPRSGSNVKFLGIDIVGEQRGFNQFLNTVERGRQQFVTSQITSSEKATQAIVGNMLRQGQEQARIAERASRTVATEARKETQVRNKETRESQTVIARFERERARIAEANARAITRTEKALNDQRVRDARRTATQIANSLNQARPAVGLGAGAGAFLGGIAGGVLGVSLASITSELRQGASAWIDYASKIENARIAFSVMLGSSQAAEAHLKELQQFALTTPFAFDELVDASQRMQALGFEANEVVPILRDVGNAVAAAGGGGDRLERTIKALADVRAKEKLQSQEVRQFAEAGISVFKILQEETGKSVTEIQKLIEAGEISSDLFLRAFQKFSQIHFGDLMERQSRTFLGAMSNIRDVLLQTANTAFEPLFRKISEIAFRTQNELQQVQNLDEVGEILGDAFVEVGLNLAQQIAEGIGRRLADPRFWVRYISATPRALEAALRQAVRDSAIETAGTFIPIIPLTREIIAPAPVPAGAIPPIKIPDLRTPLPPDASRDAVEKRAERAVTILKTLERQLILTAGATREMETRQKLLAEGISDVTQGAAREAIELARAQDRILQLLKTAELLSGIASRGRELEAERNAQIQRSLDDLINPIGDVEQRLAELRAEQSGGRTEVEKFNQVLGLQAKTFLNLTDEGLEVYRRKFQEIDRLQAESTIAHRIQELGNEAFRLRESVDGVLPPLKEFELWQKQNAKAATLGKAKLEELKNAFIDLAAATETEKVKRGRAEALKSIEGIGKDIESQFRTGPDDAINRLAESLQRLEFLEIEPTTFEAFIGKLRDGSLEGQQAIDLIASTLSQGNLGPELEATAKKIAALFVRARELNELLAREDATAKYTSLVAQLGLVLETDAARTHRARIAKELLKDAYQGLTQAQRQHLLALADEADAAERAREAQERRRRQLQDLAHDLGTIFSDITDAIGQGTEKFFESIRSQVLGLARDIKQQLFTGLFESLLTGEARPGTGLAGIIADKILGGIGIKVGPTQQVVVEDNTKATKDNTAAIKSLTGKIQGQAGDDQVSVGTDNAPAEAADRLLNRLNLPGWLTGIFRIFGGGRQHGGGVEAGRLYRVNEDRLEFFRPNVSGQVLSLSQEQMTPRPQQNIVENRTIVAVGDRAIMEAQRSYGRSRDGRRAQLVNARWHRKVLEFS